MHNFYQSQIGSPRSPSNADIAGDPNPLTTKTSPISISIAAFHDFVVDKLGDFIFDVQVDHRKSQSTADKHPERGRVSSRELL